MGLLGNGPEKKKRGQHGPPRAGADRLAGAKARAINMALSKHPELAEQIALKELGLDPLADVDPFEKFLTQLQQFRGAVPEVREMERPPGLVDWQALGTGLAAALAPVLLTLVGNVQGGPLGGGLGATAPPAPPRPTANGAAHAPPAPAPVRSIDQAEAADGAAVEAAEPVDQAAAAAVPVAERRRSDELPGKSSWQSGMAVSMLAGRTPAEAAAQLNGMTGFDVPVLVGWLCRTPDAELMHYLARIGGQQPHLDGLVAWCQLDAEWTIEVVRELRLLTAVKVPSAAADAPAEPAAY